MRMRILIVPRGVVLACSLRVLSGTPAKTVTSFESLTPHVGLFHDTVNVGVIRSHDKALLIGSGDGAILEAAKSLGINSIDWVLYTDHHRDQCEGAARLKTSRCQNCCTCR